MIDGQKHESTKELRERVHGLSPVEIAISVIVEDYNIRTRHELDTLLPEPLLNHAAPFHIAKSCFNDILLGEDARKLELRVIQIWRDLPTSILRSLLSEDERTYLLQKPKNLAEIAPSIPKSETSPYPDFVL